MRSRWRLHGGGPNRTLLMKRCYAFLAWTVIMVTGGLPAVRAQSNPIAWSLKESQSAERLRPGRSFSVDLTASIEEGWHVYAITQRPRGPAPMRITVLPEGQPFTFAGDIRSPKSDKAFDRNFNIITEFFDVQATFTIPLRVAPDTDAGNRKLEVDVYFQTCNAQFCLPAQTVKTELMLKVEKGVGKAARSGAPTLPSRSVVASSPVRSSVESEAQDGTRDGTGQSKATMSPFSSADVRGGADLRSKTLAAGAKRTAQANQNSPSELGLPSSSGQPSPIAATRPSLWPFLWLAATVGLLSLLTPCVFPMIPITVSYFTSHAGVSRRSAVGNAFVYGLGIILTFIALGMALTSVVGAGGINQFAANPWMNLVITAIFLGLALNLFGVYDVGVPGTVLTRLDRLTRRKDGSQLVGTLLMGLVFTLTSFTCTAPFIGTLLVMTAQGDWRWPLVGMFTYSVVFAVPFVLLALIPQLVSQTPRSGPWLQAVKVLMGFVEIAAALKFLSNADLVWRWGVFTRQVVLIGWVVIAALMALYAARVPQSRLVAPRRASPGRLATIVGCVGLVVFLASGLWGRRLGELEAFLPPASDGSGHVAAGSLKGELPWILNDYSAALAEAKRQRKPLIIDFTGYTCTNCRWMEANMFPRPEVKAQLDKFVRVRLYTDGSGPVFENQQRMERERFGTVALPLYVIVYPDGIPVATFPGLTRDSAQFIAFLQHARRS